VRHTRKLIAVVLGGALALSAAACRKQVEHPATARAKPAAQAAAAQHYILRGVIREIAADRSEITVEHEAVAGYMPAMTMSFPVKDDPRVIQILRPGDRIEATLSVDSEGIWLEKILTRGFEPAAVAAASQAAAAKTPVIPQPNRAVAVGDMVPDFSLIDQTGKAVQLSKLRGEPVAVTFLYTRCPVATACPLTTAKFSKLDAMLAEKHFGRLLTVTVEPEHDTPKVLADYAKHAGADPKRWSFLTGNPQDVSRVASDFGVLYYPDHGQIVHGLAVAVIDPSGRLATIYYGDSWQPEHLLRDMEKARNG
jgi:protein SCO1/2